MRVLSKNLPAYLPLLFTVGCYLLFTAFACENDDGVRVKEVSGISIDHVSLLWHPDIDLFNEDNRHTGASFSLAIKTWPDGYFADQSYDLLATDGQFIYFPYSFTFNEVQRSFDQTDLGFWFYHASWSHVHNYANSETFQMAKFRFYADDHYLNDNEENFDVILYDEETNAEIRVRGEFVLE